MNKNYSIINQRKVQLLSAFFLLFGLLITACKKPESKIGAEVYDPNELLDANGVDTFELITYSTIEDSSITSNQNTVLLGSYNDPTFGQVDASFFAQFRIEADAPNFGDLSAITYDSVVLSLVLTDNYGSIDAAQTYEVYQLNEDLNIDSVYYAFSTFDTIAGDLVVPGKGTITPDPYAETIIANDTLDPSLRIPLDTNYGKAIFNAGAAILTDNTTFLPAYKGLLIKTNNPSWSQGKGCVLSINGTHPDTKITIYYKQDSLQKQFRLLLSSYSAYFNRVKIENAGTPVKQEINDSTLGKYEFYAQANLVKAHIDFPSVSNLGLKTVIHRASLYLPFSYYVNDAIYPSVTLQATSYFNGIGEIGVTSTTGDYGTKRYILDLTNYLQALVGGNYDNNGLNVFPQSFGNSVERIIFNGVHTPNKEKPKLVITYTNF